MIKFTGYLLPTFCLIQTKKFSVYSKVDSSSKAKAMVYLDIVCPYTDKIIRDCLRRRPWCQIAVSNEEISKKPPRGLRQYQISDFENIDWAPVLSGRHVASSYLVRKGLSRKAQLSLQIKRFLSKNPESVMKKAVPYTVIIETWDAFEDVRMNFGGGVFASFNTAQIVSTSLRKRLDFCLEEVKNIVNAQDMASWVWILKPSVTNKGMDIGIVKGWEEILDFLNESPDIREWVLQQYIHCPLLVEGGHKFHLRVYVVCIGALSVFVYNNILMLIGAHKFNIDDLDDIYGHLTNTARAVEDIDFVEEKFVQLLDDLPAHLLRDYAGSVPTPEVAEKILNSIREKINCVTHDLFSCFDNEYTIFAPMSNCFEVYGLDFMVDESFEVYLLEVNPGPDFKQTGGRLQEVIVQLWEQISGLIFDSPEILVTHKGLDESSIRVPVGDQIPKDMTLVYTKEWSASKMQGGMKLNN